MIVGLGNDLIRVSRIERVLARHGQRFIDRLLTDEERATLPAATICAKISNWRRDGLLMRR